MATGRNPATRSDQGGRGFKSRRLAGAGRVRRGGAGIAAVAAAMLVLPTAAQTANTVQITKLSDVAVGTIANLESDTVRSENVCIFSGRPRNGYNVQAQGSGAGNAFTLSNGSNALAYEVQWAGSSGASSGTGLSTGVPLTGLTTAATDATCSSGPTTTATLFVVIRSTAASSATAGDYSGTLTLVFGYE